MHAYIHTYICIYVCVHIPISSLSFYIYVYDTRINILFIYIYIYRWHDENPNTLRNLLDGARTQIFEGNKSFFDGFWWFNFGEAYLIVPKSGGYICPFQNFVSCGFLPAHPSTCKVSGSHVNSKVLQGHVMAQSETNKWEKPILLMMCGFFDTMFCAQRSCFG